MRFQSASIHLNELVALPKMAECIREAEDGRIIFSLETLAAFEIADVKPNVMLALANYAIGRQLLRQDEALQEMARLGYPCHLQSNGYRLALDIPNRVSISRKARYESDSSGTSPGTIGHSLDGDSGTGRWVGLAQRTSIERDYSGGGRDD